MILVSNQLANMAVTRRGYIFSAFFLSLLCVLLIVIALASDSWIVSGATQVGQFRDSSISYGLFKGHLQINTLATPSDNTLYVVCLSGEGVCALSCKTDRTARELEVFALSQGQRADPACISNTAIEEGEVDPPMISYAFYVCLLLLLALQLLFAVLAALLAIINATRNPTEPIIGLPGCLLCNVVTAILGLAVLMTFGIYYATSGLNQHLGMGHIALGFFTPTSPGLGFCYWLVLVAVICSITNVGLLELRKYLLERDPPPPTIKVENHSDGTIFLY